MPSPPWKPEPGHGEFRDVRRMSDAEIARADVACPGSATELLQTAATESFQVLREKARVQRAEAAAAARTR